MTSPGALSGSARAYVGLVILGGVCLLGFAPAHLPAERSLSYLLLLAGACIAGALTQIFRVEGSTSKTSYNLGLVVFGFSLLVLGSSSAMIVVLFACLVDWERRRYLWFIQIFNIATLMVGLSAGGMIYRAILDGHSALSVQGAIGASAAVLVFVLLNHLMVGLAVFLGREESFADSGVLGKLSLSMDAALFATGAAAGLLWLVNPWTASLLLIPLYMLNMTLRVPSLERQATTDPKTGLFNTRYFEEALEKELTRANRFERPLTLVVGDLDLLRNINNTYGHLAGDAVLIGIARILRESFRDYDIIARFGGEEFTILMPETTMANAVPRIERVRREIQAASFRAPSTGQIIKVTMSFGVAQRSRGEVAAQGLLHDADLALYRAKLEGRNLVRVAEPRLADAPAYETAPWEASETKEAADSGGACPSAATEAQAIQRESADQLLCQTGGKAEIQGEETSAEDRAASLPCATGRSKRCLAVFITGVVLCAVGATVASILLGSWPHVPWYELAFFLVVSVTAEVLAVEIYTRDTSVSTASAPFVAAAMLFGPMAALLLSAALAVAAMIKHRSSPSHFVFNMSTELLAGLGAAWLVKLAGYAPSDTVSWGYLVLSVAALAIMFAITTPSVAVALGLSGGGHVAQIWKDRFSWLFPYYLGLGVIAFALTLGFQLASYLGALVVLAPLVIVRYGEKQYVSKTRELVAKVQKTNEALEEHAREISELNEGLLGALAKAVDLRDPFVLGHSEYVSHYAVLLARELKLPQERVELVRKAGLLHDIGKLGIADEILFKPGRLNDAEYERIKIHSRLAEELLGVCPSLGSLARIVLYHHERYDGRGYPAGLRGEEIPLESRILAVADTVEAMASERPYRDHTSIRAIIEELEKNAGEQFDARVVAALNAIVKREGERVIVNSAAEVRARHEAIDHPKGEQGFHGWRNGERSFEPALDEYRDEQKEARDHPSRRRRPAAGETRQGGMTSPKAEEPLAAPGPPAAQGT